MTEKQISLIEHSFKPSDVLVFLIGRDVYCCMGGYTKRKGKVRLKECYRINRTCFINGHYDGDFLLPAYSIILKDPHPTQDLIIATRYKLKDVVLYKEVKKI